MAVPVFRAHRQGAARGTHPVSTGAGRFPISQGLAWGAAFRAGCAHLTKQAQVAQLVEQRTENPRVGGSNPPLGTTPFLVL